jgi:photosystem II stability/assembly factor-like uncharacterized protein
MSNRFKSFFSLSVKILTVSVVIGLFLLLHPQADLAQSKIEQKSFAENKSSAFRNGRILKAAKKKFSKARTKKRKRLKRKRLKKKILSVSHRIPAPQIEEEFEENGEKRQDWFNFQRAYPFNEIPADARRKASEKRPTEARSANGLETAAWQSIGPFSTNSYYSSNWGLTSGRVNAIAVSPSNPQLILAGAATGGIWRSIDGGANFAPVSDGEVDLAVGSIAFAPSDPSTVYAGMGDSAGGYLGSGVLKSADAGQTWTRVSNQTLPAPGSVTKIQVDPGNPNRVYAAQFAFRNAERNNSVYASGFFVSNDGGVNWVKTLNGRARDLVIHTTQPNTLYLAMAVLDTNSIGGVFKSTDGGQNWARVYTSPFSSTSNIKIAVTPGAPQNLYVLVGTETTARVEISTDEGATWINRASAFDTRQFGYNCYLFVHPTNPNTIYVGTRDLWRSLDGGVTYSNITKNFPLAGGYTPGASKSHPDQHHLYISPTDPNTVYVANDGGVWRSTDGLNTLKSLNATLNLTMFNSLATHPTDPMRTYGGTQDNGTQKRVGANSWREFRPGDGGQTIIDPVDPSIVYSTYTGHVINLDVNNGDSPSGGISDSSTFVIAGTPDRVAFYPPFVGNGVDSTLYFGTHRLHTSTNRGGRWTAPGGTLDLTKGSGDTLSAIAVGKSDTKIIYTGSSQGNVMVSKDAGVTWTRATNGLPNRFIKSIKVSPTDSNVAYLTVSGYDSGHVFKTVNAGASWTNINGNLPNIPTNTLLIDPNNPNTLYVGTDIGIFRSLNDGGSWESFNSGLPPVIITALTIQPGTGLIQAASYGRGAFELNTSTPIARKTKFDYDGDGKADVSVYRPENGVWYLNRSTAGFTGIQFGLGTDKITPADYDGDGKTDIAVFRPENGVWYLLQSRDGFKAVQFGTQGDVPAAADFDGDGKADLAVFRPSNGVWYLLRSRDGFAGIQFGAQSDIPVAGDYDADGKADIAVWRPSNGVWYLLGSSQGFTAFAFGQAGDITTAADFDGDGKTDAAVFRPSSGTWYLLQSTAGFSGVQFGTNEDKPAAADYDGDGRADIAVFRPSNGVWYLLRSTTGFTGLQFGINIDIPTASVPGQ